MGKPNSLGVRFIERVWTKSLNNCFQQYVVRLIGELAWLKTVKIITFVERRPRRREFLPVVIAGHAHLNMWKLTT